LAVCSLLERMGAADAATGGQGGAALRASLLRTRTPVVMIRSSAAVETECARSGLTAAELLRPFGLRAPTALNVPIRTAGDHPPYRLHDLPLRMVHWSAVRVCDNAKDADDALAAQVTQVRYDAVAGGQPCDRRARRSAR
jgi:hypothetical protein